MTKKEKENLIVEHKKAIIELNKLNLIDSVEVLKQEIKKLRVDLYLEDYDEEID